jgi:NAD(P)-dependent dehydrogenase (short-subunit alcohol dehydrogenase family)
MSGFSLPGRNAVLTGGSRGIARAIALRLAETGANIALPYRERADDAHAVAREIKAKGCLGVALQMDVTDRAQVERAASEARRGLGPISILINNADINKPTGFDRVTDEDWDSVLATNLKGRFICAHAFLPHLAETGKGAIVHISSVGGQYGGPRTAPYAASKAGLMSLAQDCSLRRPARRVLEHDCRRTHPIRDGRRGHYGGVRAESGGEHSLEVARRAQRSGGRGRVSGVRCLFLHHVQTLNVNGGLYF